MAEGTYLSWNIPNWITVLLMVGIGMAVVAGGASLIRQALPSA